MDRDVLLKVAYIVNSCKNIEQLEVTKNWVDILLYKERFNTSKKDIVDNFATLNIAILNKEVELYGKT